MILGVTFWLDGFPVYSAIALLLVVLPNAIVQVFTNKCQYYCFSEHFFTFYTYVENTCMGTLEDNLPLAIFTSFLRIHSDFESHEAFFFKYFICVQIFSARWNSIDEYTSSSVNCVHGLLLGTLHR